MNWGSRYSVVQSSVVVKVVAVLTARVVVAVVVAFEPAFEPELEPELVPGLVLVLELVPVMKKKEQIKNKAYNVIFLFKIFFFLPKIVIMYRFVKITILFTHLKCVKKDEKQL